jgi:Uncharacterized protein conserved in bacteria
MNRQKKEIEKKRQLELLAITPIDNFRGEYRFLSNFSPAIIVINNLTFQSTEAPFQAFKSCDPKIWAEFTHLTPSESKRRGHEIECRNDWEEIKNHVMWDLLNIKFSQDLLKAKLQATAPRNLVEGNNWHDTVWGVCIGCKKFGKHPPIGENRLGRMLMGIRDGKMLNDIGLN